MAKVLDGGPDLRRGGAMRARCRMRRVATT
jgi:hypothetical protein